MIVVRAKIKDVANDMGRFSVSSDFADALDAKVKEIIRAACERAKANGRKTLMPRDI